MVVLTRRRVGVGFFVRSSSFFRGSIGKGCVGDRQKIIRLFFSFVECKYPLCFVVLFDGGGRGAVSSVGAFFSGRI